MTLYSSRWQEESVAAINRRRRTSFPWLTQPILPHPFAPFSHTFLLHEREHKTFARADLTSEGHTEERGPHERARATRTSEGHTEQYERKRNWPRQMFLFDTERKGREYPSAREERAPEKEIECVFDGDKSAASHTVVVIMPVTRKTTSLRAMIGTYLAV